MYAQIQDYTPTLCHAKAAALALAEFPSVNASLAADQSAVTQHGAKNIGVAVATPHGLAVPNIKNVEVRAVMFFLMVEKEGVGSS